mmetsp:Transcript_9909/g.14604  ORF Transcript_9909/g.14604 Transcript_9909/m.14604 type:complete len:533 (-) Transcript_9909:126-1724(-)|eukprot:CAMPEP_0194225812 /NCGR_PEP_ID=MMETSP0156-20130528/40419_1 /TAXON_ID=33649 /ORGANISM="Thalassionema nitzschioides, Strain L26-B" /LENGTH=532 /DNA_ID=CAMNT_0038957915 /DNA_START=109 /DNA_END=1707 /DNA_ORIENTATION=+
MLRNRSSRSEKSTDDLPAQILTPSPSKKIKLGSRSRRSSLCLIFGCLSVIVIVLLLDSSKRNHASHHLKTISLQHQQQGYSDKLEHNEKQKEIVEEALWSWNAYADHAWGQDELHPLSQSGGAWLGSMGLTLVDSLDTLLIMGLTDKFNDAREWVKTSLNFDQDVEVNLFETTIRVLGGLLSAFALSEDELFLDKAVDLGERLLVAFETSTKIPVSDVNLGKRKPRAAQYSSTSETSTLHLEFCYLSYLTERSEFCDAVTATDDKLAELAPSTQFPYLLPILINPKNAVFSGAISLGARGDSYYEYLLKSWLQSGRTNHKLKDRYLNAVNAIQKHLVQTTKSNKFVYIAELVGGKGSISRKMDHLVCFLPGVLALGVHYGAGGDAELKLAKDLLETCWLTYSQQPTGLGPEIVFFDQKEGEDITVKQQDSHNLLRPETAESLFVMWRLTHDNKYREYGWSMFESFRKYARVDTGGYASIDSVKTTDVRRRDKMESFWMAETLKYLFLLFSDDDTISLEKYVLNTEAHPLPIF